MSDPKPIRVRYQTLEFGDVDIHVRTLRDNQQFADDDGEAERLGISSAAWPLFGVVWTSGEVLARFMNDYDIDGLRILEFGCGIGLTTLLLNQRSADITATDHHPSVGDFLEQNVVLNLGRPVPFIRTGWADGEAGLGLFDLIVASDVLYEAAHVELVSAFIDQHAKPTCVVVIVDPGRGQQGRFGRAMAGRGFVHDDVQVRHEELVTGPFKGRIGRYIRTEPG